jgi:type I restriction enzyme M protein
MQFSDNEKARVFDANEFAYWKITVCQPKRTPDGKVETDKKGNPIADTDLTDTEQVPFTYEGGIQSFFDNEVLPYTESAWIDDKQTKIGYEISFTKYFYKPIALRPLEEIVGDIKKLEAETKGLLEKIVDG